MQLTSKERFGRILKHQRVNRIGLFEVFWRETVQKWSQGGYFAQPEMVSDHFGLDVRRTGGEITPGDYRTINLVADIDAGEQIVEETDSVKLVRDGNGALLRWIKTGSGAPEHEDFAHSCGLQWCSTAMATWSRWSPALIEAGINCLQRLEVKAGMDERVLESNDLQAVEAELKSKLPGAMAGSGYVLQVDHSVSPLVEYGTYKYFVERGLEIGTYRAQERSNDGNR